jgi:hypothetical protein
MHAWPLNFRLKFGDASRRWCRKVERKKSDSQWMCSTGQSTTPRDAKRIDGGLTKAGKPFVVNGKARMFYPECWDERV